jgi:quinol monooxygenase YgiN
MSLVRRYKFGALTVDAPKSTLIQSLKSLGISRKNKSDMKYLNLGVPIFFLFLLGISCKNLNQTEKENSSDAIMIRIAEIEIDSIYLDRYIPILKRESEASVKLESGVICIYPMFQKEDPTKIRLLEIYASKDAYESHLQAPHFKEYKTKTLEMVKSLKLVDMDAIDVKTMSKIFKKMNK